jgi:hypothetical protein
MSGPVRSLCLIALLSCGGTAAAVAPARAIEDSRIAQALPSPRAAIPAPSDRRPGELEGTPAEDRKTKPAGKAAGKKTAAQADKKSGQAAAEKSRDDGGLPLPREHGDDRSAPIGFDANGKLGTGFKF